MFIEKIIEDLDVKNIALKVMNGERISLEEGVTLYENADMAIN